MELKQLESELAKELTPSQTDHAMRIIRGAGEYASFEESDENEVSQLMFFFYRKIYNFYSFTCSSSFFYLWIIFLRQPLRIMNYCAESNLEITYISCSDVAKKCIKFEFVIMNNQIL